MPLPEGVATALAAIRDGRPATELETDRLDFNTLGRSIPDTLADLAEAAACFANSQGGTLVVGVADKLAGSRAFVGSGDLDPVRTQRRIYELTRPALIVNVELVETDGTSLLVIEVPRSPDVHQVHGRSTERVGTSCEPMTAMRIASVVADRRGHDWSAEASGVDPEAVTARAVEDVRRLLASAPDAERPRWASLSEPDLLRRLGLIGRDATLTNGGALLLASENREPMVAYTHRRLRSGELTHNETLTGAGLPALLRCLELIDNRADRTPISLPNGQQLFIADLPEVAVREAVVNAFMHRDYQASGPVQVEHATTRLAVTSPGAFVLGVTPENVLTVSSRSRNVSLSTVIRHLGLAETAGVGVDRMYAEMARVGHQPPRFESDRFRVTVILDGGAPNSAVTRFANTLPDQWRTNPDALLVMLTLLNHRTVTAAGMAPLLQKDDPEVEVVLRQLAGVDGFVERTRGSATHRAGVYRLRGGAVAALGAAVTYRRRVEDDTDRKIVEIVREAGQVNGRMVRTLLDVDTPTASRILADLVDRGVLVKTSDAQRGPSVTYGRGPQFPVRPRGRNAPGR